MLVCQRVVPFAISRFSNALAHTTCPQAASWGEPTPDHRAKGKPLPTPEELQYPLVNIQKNMENHNFHR